MSLQLRIQGVVLAGAGAPPGLADPKTTLFALEGTQERSGSHLPDPSLSPRMEESPLVTPTDSHLMDKDLSVEIVEADHVGEGNPHAQESCRRERRNQVQLGGTDGALLEHVLC